jgi:hypothetical protein
VRESRGCLEYGLYFNYACFYFISRKAVIRKTPSGTLRNEKASPQRVSARRWKAESIWNIVYISTAQAFISSQEGLPSGKPLREPYGTKKQALKGFPQGAGKQRPSGIWFIFQLRRLLFHYPEGCYQENPSGRIPITNIEPERRTGKLPRRARGLPFRLVPGKTFRRKPPRLGVKPSGKFCNNALEDYAKV